MIIISKFLARIPFLQYTMQYYPYSADFVKILHKACYKGGSGIAMSCVFVLIFPSWSLLGSRQFFSLRNPHLTVMLRPISVWPCKHHIHRRFP